MIKFKFGDRVRVVKSLKDFYTGATGRVVKYMCVNKEMYYNVELDGSRHELYCEEAQLEAV